MSDVWFSLYILQEMEYGETLDSIWEKMTPYMPYALNEKVINFQVPFVVSMIGYATAQCVKERVANAICIIMHRHVEPNVHVSGSLLQLFPL